MVRAVLFAGHWVAAALGMPKARVGHKANLSQ